MNKGDKSRAATPAEEDEIMNAQITSKIVDVTGNDATRAFIGKTVTKRNTASGTVYAIGNTGYVLSVAEYRAFAAAGAIAEAAKSNTKARKRPKETTTVKQNKIRKAVANSDTVEKAEKRAMRDKETTESNAAVVDSVNAEPKGLDLDPETTGYMETSPFLLNYPKPEFNLDEPARQGLFDHADDIGAKISGFFDRLGRRGRDKLVASFEGEEEEDDLPDEF